MTEYECECVANAVRMVCTSFADWALAVSVAVTDNITLQKIMIVFPVFMTNRTLLVHSITMF